MIPWWYFDDFSDHHSNLGDFALQLFEALFQLFSKPHQIIRFCRQCLLLQVISLCSFLIQGLHDLRTMSWRIGRIWIDSNDFSGAYEFGKRKTCTFEKNWWHTYPWRRKVAFIPNTQTFGYTTTWVYRAWQFCSCLSLSSKSSCFSVCRLECGNDVDGSFRLARCPGDEPSVPKPSLSAPFASHDLGRSKMSACKNLSLIDPN